VKLQKVQKKQMKGVAGPQLYACTVEFTGDELASFIDNVVVETSPGVAEDLTSFVLTKVMGLRSPRTTSKDLLSLWSKETLTLTTV
jgi:hypothetical protein